MSQTRWRHVEAMEVLGPLAVLDHNIRDHTMLKPSAVMLPLSFEPTAEQVLGYPVVRGDRFALIYEPPRGPL